MRHARTAAVVLSILLALSTIEAQAEETCTLDRATGTTIDAQPVLKNAYSARWNIATNRISFMQPNDKGYYRVFTMNPDGSDRRSMTPDIGDRHAGTTYWHPSGRYLMYTVQKPDWKGRTLFGIPDYDALPGYGLHDDIWLSTVDGGKRWQLTNEDNTKDEGALIPVFSPDGKHVAWSARQPGGKYKIEVADFVEKPQPHLQNARSYQPGGAAYYETGSFTSDSASIIYTSDQDTHSFWHSQIYRLDIATGKGVRLTVGNDYNEHPTVISTPTGDWIVYMSTKGVNRYPWHVLLGTDWYAMKPDGSGAKRLTTMNVNRKDNPENTGKMQVGCTVAVAPSGDFMLGDVQDDLMKQTGMIKLVRFSCQ